jgi:hypothetical protein
MSHHLDGPADTTMMGVVHDALRRDIGRLQTSLAPPAIPGDDRRHALARHALWMMDFLHDHHRGEDEGLWPLVTGRNPQAAGLLAAMEAEHALIVPAADRLSGRHRTEVQIIPGAGHCASNKPGVVIPALAEWFDRALGHRPVLHETW